MNRALQVLQSKEIASRKKRPIFDERRPRFDKRDLEKKLEMNRALQVLHSK